MAQGLTKTPGLTLKGMHKLLGMLFLTNFNILIQLNQPNIPTHLGQTIPPYSFSQVLSMCIEPLRTHIRYSISVFPSDLMMSGCGWMKACLQRPMFCSREPTNCLRIQQNEKSTQEIGMVLCTVTLVSHCIQEWYCILVWYCTLKHW